MNIAQIENSISNLVKKINPESFIYDLLLAYGLPKASITRLQKGNLNLSKRSGEISWKRKVLFREEHRKNLHLLATELVKEAIHDQRFVITTDYKTLLAVDTKTNDKLDISIAELHKHFDFFLPWAGMEKSQHHGENPADVKAAEKMAKLFDEIKRENHSNTPEFDHNLNVFLSRLLFCYFAEDTSIFEKGQFINAISSHTQEDGSDLGVYLDKLFIVLNTPEKERKNLPAFLNAFPYVNGGLFKLKLQSPNFTRRSRQAVIDCGDMDWSEINPDIFGSMMQAVVTPENRGGLGMHYTSVPNIMKVIKPLFLDELYSEFEKAKGNLKKLSALLARIYKVKVFDPACGSGNFLIVAYKELRKLEMKIFKAGNMLPMSRILLSQFYGIEIDDFAHEIAQLSLWLAEHQMNQEFYKEFGKTAPALPLKEAGNIVCGNACRVDWNVVCPNLDPIGEEVYVLGNPPYLGGKFQSNQQKEDMVISFERFEKIGELDYIASWFIKAAKYKPFKFAFVTTSSLCQGSQVHQLWPLLLENDLEIVFAYKPFYWSNSAKDKAAVIVTIIGLMQSSSTATKYIISGNLIKQVKNINPYLVEGKNTIVQQRLKPLSNFPEIITGNSPYDGGNLILSENEANDLRRNFPKTAKILKRLYGSQDYLNGICRWCLWIEDKHLAEALKIGPVKERIEKTKQFRIQGGDVARGLVNRAHQFRYTYTAKEKLIIIPRVSSERRKYIPFGFLDSNCIISDSAQAIYDPPLFIFGIISSKMHMLWIRRIAGRLKADYRYSSALCYNTFPFPSIDNEKKEAISKSVLRILSERECFPEKTLSEIYDPDKMSINLLEAHKSNDILIERCYRSKPFESDEERLEHLFNLYEQMIEEDKNQGTLFATEKKIRKRKS